MNTDTKSGIQAICPVRYEKGILRVLDQTRLPGEKRYVELDTVTAVCEAIQRLVVRGAPAIGVAAAYGLCVAARVSLAAAGETGEEEAGDLLQELRRAGDRLIASRPTAVNLAWAVRRMLAAAESAACKAASGIALLGVLEREAEAIRAEDAAACRAIGEYGLSLLRPGMRILTHCNAGALASAGYGTALAPIHLGQEKGYHFSVYADETRPLLQGARLTAWELAQSGVAVTLLCDSMANALMERGLVDAVLVGCDRMAANGDGANKIGTAGLSVLAEAHAIPFYMLLPTSTIDLEMESGKDIPIEERDGEELRSLWYKQPMAPAGIKTFNPAFDVTDHRRITAVITERGIARPPYEKTIKELMKSTEASSCIR